MRQELAEILSGRYGEAILSTVVSVDPTDRDVENYQRHNGLVFFLIDLSRTPFLVVIDTARLILMRHAWISRSQTETLTLFVSSGVQQLSKSHHVQTYDQKVEGLELTFHYSPRPIDRKRDIPYKAELKPLW
ncbi:MAG: hypothetical protein AAB414_04825 [Patescibacteria group bacterium]